MITINYLNSVKSTPRIIEYYLNQSAEAEHRLIYANRNKIEKKNYSKKKKKKSEIPLLIQPVKAIISFFLFILTRKFVYRVQYTDT